MELAAEWGILPPVLMDMTMRETVAALTGAAKREQARYRLVLWGAWHGAQYHRAKRLPSLKLILDRLFRRREKGPPDFRRLLAQADAINAALGGEPRDWEVKG